MNSLTGSFTRPFLNLTFFCILVLIWFSANLVQAQATIPTDLDGYAWSSNIGWISMNCRTGGVNGGNICGTSNYKVTINANNTVTGYAWSSNIGWIKFGGLSGFPTEPGNIAQNAQVTGTYPTLQFRGWARACAATVGRNCSSMTTDPNSLNWSGWISLDGNSHDVRMSAAGMVNNSYAWGSNVVGWIDMFSRMDPMIATGTISGTTTGNACTIALGSSTCTARLNWQISALAPTPNIFNDRTDLQISTLRSAMNVAITIGHGTTTFLARSGTNELDRVNLRASCATGSVWNSTSNRCVAITPSPSATIDGTTCTINVGSSTCGIQLDWQFFNVATSARNISRIRPPSTASTTISSAASADGFVNQVGFGTSTFRARSGSTILDSVTLVTRCRGASTWNGTICDGTANGDITAGSIGGPSCTIANGASTCTVNLTWTTINASEPSVFNQTLQNEISTAASGTNVPVTLTWGSNSILLLNGVDILDTHVANASCAVGSAWNTTTGRCVTETDTATISASNCTIPSGASSCTVSDLTWSISAGATSPQVFNERTDQLISTNRTGSGVSITVDIGSTVVSARDGSVILNSDTIRATCIAGTGWDDTTQSCIPGGVSCIPGDPACVPTLSLVASAPIVRQNDTVNIQWNISPGAAASQCQLVGPLESIDNPIPGTGNVQSLPLRSQTTFRLICTSPLYGTVVEQLVVNVVPTAQEI